MKNSNNEGTKSPRCPKCGFVMCEQFDVRRVNERAELATPNGTYICYGCNTRTDLATQPAEEGDGQRCIKCKHSRHYFDEATKRCAAAWADFPSCYCECVFTTADPDKLIAAAPTLYTIGQKILAKLDSPTESVTAIDADELRAALAAVADEGEK